MRPRSAPILALALLLGGCPPTVLPLDGGGETGARRSLPGCVNPVQIAGMTGLVSVPIDTRNGEAGAVGLPCTTDGSPAPQYVVAYQVPGTGPTAIDISTANPGTDRNFDTVVAVRRTCLPRSVGEAADACFDDEVGRTRETRARGTILAQGGETLYLFVTGYGTMYMDLADEGLAQLDITARPVTPPTIEESTVLITDSAVRIEARGGDEGRDATGVWVTFHGPAGELLDRNADGRFDDGDALTGNFDRPVLGTTNFVETATLEATGLLGVSLVRVRVIDRAGVLSERTITLPARYGAVVGPGDTCGPLAICGPELTCDSMSLCTPAPDRVAACGLATAIDLMAPTDGRATVTTRQDVLSAGPGLFEASCSDASGGQEDLYLVRVPAGRFDVILTTDSPGSSGLTPRDPDTILYVRRTCTDASSGAEAECNDDIVRSENQRSTVEIRDIGGVDLSVFVEIYNGAPEGEGVRYELAATLRPVLMTGASCDPLGEENRCDLGTCSVATRVCP